MAKAAGDVAPTPIAGASTTGGATVRLPYRTHPSPVIRAAGCVRALGVSSGATVRPVRTLAVTPKLPGLDIRSVEVPAGELFAALATLRGRADVLRVDKVVARHVRREGDHRRRPGIDPRMPGIAADVDDVLTGVPRGRPTRDAFGRMGCFLPGHLTQHGQACA